MIGVSIFDDNQIGQMVKLYESGTSVKQLSIDYHVTTGTIRRTLRIAGVYKERPKHFVREIEPTPGITRAEVEVLKLHIHPGSRVPIEKKIISYEHDKYVIGYAEVLSVHNNVVRTTAGDTTFADILIASRQMRKGQKNEQSSTNGKTH